MPRLYTVEFDATTWANASGDIDVFSFKAAQDKPIELLGVELGQSSEPVSEEEYLRFRVIRGHTTVGSGGASATPRPNSPLDTAASFTARTNDTTVASAGTGVNLWSGVWNNRAPGPLWPPLPQGGGFWVSGADYLVVRLLTTVADDYTNGASGTAYLVEYP